jgi:hypothetical protein
VRVTDNVNVSGDVNLRGALNLSNALTVNSVLSGTASVMTFGRPGDPAPTFNACLSPSQDPWFSFGGRIQLFDGRII